MNNVVQEYIECVLISVKVVYIDNQSEIIMNSTFTDFHNNYLKNHM